MLVIVAWCVTSLIGATTKGAVGVVLNEVLVWNTSVTNHEGHTAGWIELHNTGAGPIDLNDTSLSDTLLTPRRWVFPTGTVIAAGGMVVVFCDAGSSASSDNTGFALRPSGGTVTLFAPASQGSVLRDSVDYGVQVADLSIGRAGPTNGWTLTQPTPGQANVVVPLGTSGVLRINEWMAFPTAGEDWFELFNPNPEPVALGGCFLTDDLLTSRKYQIPALSYIGTGRDSWLLCWADNTPSLGATHTNFRLNNSGESLGLFGPSGEKIDAVTFSNQTNGVSEGRFPDGSDLSLPLPAPTPGARNTAPSLRVLLNEMLAFNRSFTNQSGAAPDWVELRNPGSQSVDLSAMSLTDRVTEPRRWVFPNPTVLAAGGYLLVQCDGDQPPSATNTGFGLNADGDTLYVFESSASATNLVDALRFGLQVADLTLGRAGPDRSWRLCRPTPGTPNSADSLGDQSALRINEWMASPAGGSDWFEVFNPLAQPVDLGGLFLSDQPETWFQCPIRTYSYIGTGNQAYRVFYADGSTAPEADRVNFKLSATGETLGLYRDDGVSIDEVTFGSQQAGVSEGRLPDGDASIVAFPDTASPGKPNFQPVLNVVVNEVLTHTDPPLEDAIELYNLTSDPVNIGGWYLSDNRGDLMKYRIPSGTIVAPNGYIVFYEYQFNPLPGIWPSFELSSSAGDWVVLSEADASGNLTGSKTSVHFSPIENGVSIGRFVTSVGVDFVPLESRTFGVDQPTSLPDFRRGTGRTNAGPRVGPAVISEIMYHPITQPDQAEDRNDEYIELQNLTDAALPLYLPSSPSDVWRLDGAVEFDFPANAVIPPNGFLLVVGFDPAADPETLVRFQQKYGLTTSTPVVGPFQGRLNNQGESLELWKAFRTDWLLVFVESIQYTNNVPWPYEADGTGLSLQRFPPNSYGNEPLHWKADIPTPGAPTNPGAPDRDSDGDQLPDSWEWANGLNLLDPTDANQDPDHDGATNLQEYRAGTDPQNPKSCLKLALKLDGANVVLAFNDAASGTYSLEYRSAPEPGQWTVIAEFPGLASGQTIEVPDECVECGPVRFYRLMFTPLFTPQVRSDTAPSMFQPSNR